jgi:hypothetical protein
MPGRSGISRASFALALVLAGITSTALAATVTVTGSGDTVAVDGVVTLREAIVSLNGAANVNADVVATGTYGTSDSIVFAIPGAGVHTIQPLSQLLVTVPVTLDGYTQPGSHANTLAVGNDSVHLIEIDGSLAGAVVGGVLEIAGGNSLIRGLVVNRAQGGSSAAIKFVTLGGNTLEGTFIGLDPAGTNQQFDHCNGLRVENSNGNTIGGTVPAARNVITATNGCGSDFVLNAADATIVMNNYIGTLASGTGAGGSALGVFMQAATGSIVGSPAAGLGNVIGGHSVASVALGDPACAGNTFWNNLIGSDAGLGAPSAIGVRVSNGAHHTAIGGTGAGEGNRIAGITGTAIIVVAGAGSPTPILGNSIHDNGGLGIDLNGDGVTPNDPNDVDSGPNNLQNFPVLTSALATPTSIRIQGTLNAGVPFAAGYRIEFFSSPSCNASGFGEGKTFIGFANVMTDASGNAPIDATFAAQNAAGTTMTATATIALNTSEFSACLTAAPQPMAYFPLPPCRLVDTRDPNGPFGGPALAANSERTFVVTGSCGVPSSALAVSFNIAVTLESAFGDLRIFPAGTPLPLVSAINYRPFKTRSDDAVIGLGAAGDVTVHVDQPSGTVHLILDVDGYFQ